MHITDQKNSQKSTHVLIKVLERLFEDVASILGPMGPHRELLQQESVMCQTDSSGILKTNLIDQGLCQRRVPDI